MAEPLVLSGSSLGTYQRCPRQWYHEYVERQERPPRLKMARGLAAHEALERDLRHKLGAWEHLPREEVLQIYLDEFDKVAIDSPDTQGKDTKEDVRERGSRAVAAWYDDVAPGIEPLFVEINGQFTINEVHYDWTADLVDTEYTVRDHKFAASKPSGNMDYDPFSPNYRQSLVGYAIGLRDLTGEHESGIQLDYMVCTLKPYPMTAWEETISQEDIDEFRDAVLDAYDRITAGSFPPKGLGNRSCSWCAYTDGTCEPYRRNDARH